MTAPNQLSFLPDDYLQRKRQRRANLICTGLFVLVVGGVGTSFTLAERSLRSVELRAADVDREYADAAKRIEQVQRMQDRQKKMSRQAELTAELLEKVPRTFVLAEITNSLPAGVSLLDMLLESKVRKVVAAPPPARTAADQRRAARNKPAEPELPEAKQYDVSIRITGIASTDVQVARLISTLNQSEIFRDVNLQFSEQLKQKDTDEVMRRFVIDLMLRPDARVLPEQGRTQPAPRLLTATDPTASTAGESR
jgi:Tfp pilus assembly protein PilN